MQFSKRLFMRLTFAALFLSLISIRGDATLVPTVLQLYGPSSWAGRMVELVGADWRTPTGAYTNTTKTLWMPPGETTPLRWARWVYVWTPGSCGAGARLVAHDTFTGQVTEIARIVACGENAGSASADRIFAPDLSVVDITAALNNFAATTQGGIYIAHEIRDDGVTPTAVWESRLEMWHDVAASSDSSVSLKIDALMEVLRRLKEALP